jgi:hypothetical protein
MLTKQQIIDTFVTGIDETPSNELIEVYQNLKFTQQQLDAVIARNIAIKADPTFTQRVAEDFQRYMAATPEEQAVWTQVEPVQS